VVQYSGQGVSSGGAQRGRLDPLHSTLSCHPPVTAPSAAGRGVRSGLGGVPFLYADCLAGGQSVRYAGGISLARDRGRAGGTRLGGDG